MGAIAGPLLSVSVNGREFNAVGDANVARKLGGYENETLINGNQKTARRLKTPTPWSVTGGSFELDDSLGDLEFLTASQNSNDDLDFVFTWVSGSVYQGTGTIEGEMTDDNMTAAVTFDASGAGELKKMG